MPSTGKESPGKKRRQDCDSIVRHGVNRLIMYMVEEDYANKADAPSSSR